MSNIDEQFNIFKYRIIQDNQYYYFFRALNKGDHKDLQDGIITNKHGKIIRIRTDRARYIENPKNGKPKYDENEPISLLQVIDHIKENHRYDTNCISLSCDANVSIKYGHDNYFDEYVLVRIPKSELGYSVVNAGEYIIEEMKKMNSKIVNILKRASSSCEFIYYGEISEEKLFNASKEFIQLLAVLQQVNKNAPEYSGEIQQIENKIINLIVNGYSVIVKDGEYFISNDGTNFQSIQKVVDEIDTLLK